jgi:hypothetical protein
MEFFLPARRSAGWRVAVIAVSLGLGAGIALLLWLERLEGRITDQYVLREAVTEWTLAGEPGDGPNSQIFEQQAAQGYYDDAAATGHPFKRVDDVQWSVVELAKIRSENGDVQGAKNMIKRFAGSDLGTRATEALALTQASKGDLRGALETITPVGDSDEARLVLGRRQIASGDFDGALKTAAQMKPKSADQIFYELGDALRVRGEQKRVHQLASHMTDRKLAAMFLELSRFTLWDRDAHVTTILPTPCDDACFDATRGQFAEADALIDQNKCSNVSFVAIRQYAVDPIGGERLLRAKADPQDLEYGLDQLGVAAANNSNIAEALRFLDNLQNLSRAGNSGNVVLTEARNTELIHATARAWTIRDGPKPVLKWARSRPNTDERTWALIGIAEALGHSRPQR